MCKLSKFNDQIVTNTHSDGLVIFAWWNIASYRNIVELLPERENNYFPIHPKVASAYVIANYFVVNKHSELK